jgi:hypothetical protein
MSALCQDRTHAPQHTPAKNRFIKSLVGASSIGGTSRRYFFRRRHDPFVGKNNRRANGEVVGEPFSLAQGSLLLGRR